MRAALLLGLTACNQLFGLGPTELQTDDARTDAPGCADSPFVNPVELEGDAIGSDYDPQLSPDGSELWLAQNIGTQYDMMIATRNGSTGRFDIAMPFAHNSADQNDGDPALSADGLVLAFLSRRVGGMDVYVSARTAIDNPFTLPMGIASVPPGDVNGIDLSFDGLTLYYANSDRELYSIHRTTRGNSFGAPSAMLATDVAWPSVSPDELELYYQKSTGVGIYRRTRASTSIPFDANETQISSSGGDPDVTSDSRKLVFDGGGIYLMTRTCN